MYPPAGNLHQLMPFSLVKIVFVPICSCKNSQVIWHHSVSTSHLRDITDQPWWLYNAKSEETVLGDNGEMSDWWLFLVELYVQNIKWHVRNKIIHSLLWITIFIPSTSTKLKGGYTDFMSSVCSSIHPSVHPSVDRIVSALYLPQYWPDPLHIYTYSEFMQNSKIWIFCNFF